MPPLVDLTDQRFEMLVVKERVPNRYGQTMWLCECDCGNISVVSASHLKRGVTKSCGCLRVIAAKKANSKHGQFGTRLYNIWGGMKDRCDNKKSKDYPNWGGRGIALCEEWETFEPFYKWAMANEYSPLLQIDRKDNEKGYSPDNCRWVTCKENNNNRRSNHNITYNGATKTLTQWSEITGISKNALGARLRRYGWSVEDALTIPIDGRNDRARSSDGRFAPRN